MVTLELPWPPSVNTYYRAIGRGRVLISEKGRDYQTSVWAEVVLQIGKRLELGGRLEVEVDAYPPDQRKRDIDNLAKGLLDAIAHAQVFKNDEQIDKLTIERFPVTKGGKVIVRIVERV